MRRKDVIKRILLLAVWVMVMAGITTLLIAANRKQKAHLCNELIIGMRGGNGLYLDKSDIIRLIEKTSGNVLNRHIAKIRIARLERNLELNPWIKDAELYFDSKDALHVFVEERQPIARVFTSSGRSFYIDSSGHIMPLIEKMSARVPVVTGFPSGTKWLAKDSSLLESVKTISGFVYAHPFWNAQVGQIVITNERKFEIIPVIGDHVIKIGSADRIEEKLNRLFIFYSQVLSKVGFNKYAVLNVQYEGQVIAVKKTPVTPVDSIQLQKNIEDLMARAMIQVGDEGMMSTHDILKKDSAVSSISAKYNQVSTKTIPNPIQTPTHSIPTKTNLSNPVEKPKAVMKRRNEGAD